MGFGHPSMPFRLLVGANLGTNPNRCQLVGRPLVRSFPKLPLPFPSSWHQGKVIDGLEVLFCIWFSIYGVVSIDMVTLLGNIGSTTRTNLNN